MVRALESHPAGGVKPRTEWRDVQTGAGDRSATLEAPDRLARSTGQATVAGDGVPSGDELVTAASLAAEGGTDHVRGPISHPAILNRGLGMGKRAIFQIVLGLSVGAAAMARAPGMAPAESERTSGDARQLTPSPKRRACAPRGGLPDPACTPGAVMTTDLEVICHRPTGPRRHVDAAERRAVYREYGYTYPQRRGDFEADHLIPLELGGANSTDNLWPEAAWPRPGFHEKDEVENYLHRQVCRGRMTIARAQRAIAIDWIEAWRNMPRRAASPPR